MSSPSDPPAVVLERTEIDDGPVPALVLRCGGEIDSFNSHQLSDALGDGVAPVVGARETPAAGRLLVVDLRDVTFLGASAITALIVGAGGTPDGVAGLRLVVGTTRPVLLVVDALDLRTTFSIHPDVPDALRAPHPAAAERG